MGLSPHEVSLKPEAAPEGQNGPISAPLGASTNESSPQAHPLSQEGFHFNPLGASMQRSAPSADAPLGAVDGSGQTTLPLGSGAGHGAKEAAQTTIGSGIAVLGQLNLCYILAQKERTLLVVDQHAAHERLLFERYREAFYAGNLKTETFLVPLTLELSPQNAVLMEHYLPQWQKTGFEIEPFGPTTYVVRSAPAILSGKPVEKVLLEVLDDLALFGKSGRLEEVFNEILERVACHSAIRAGQRLPMEEMQGLMTQLATLDVNLYCPHGRPVWVEVGETELEKRFRRLV